MKPLRFFIITVITAVFALSSVANADDGEKVNKVMTRISKYPIFDQDIVDNAVPETEHAFTGMMEFYVPMQAASGATGDSLPMPDKADPREYYNVDLDLVETLEVAKPLVNVFVHGPAFEPPATAFLHSFMDTYASISLDDGMTWKETNLSQSADLTSFNIETDPKVSEESESNSLPGNHNILMEITVGDNTYSAFHASGYDTPYSKECTECHGVALQGVAQVPSCYSCHRSYQVWTEPTPVELGPIVFEAAMEIENYLTLAGVNVLPGTDVTIINAVTGETAATVEAVEPLDLDKDHTIGRFGLEGVEFEDQGIPCVVAAEYTDQTGEILMGPAMSVKDADGEPIENCAGSPVDLTEYPGGTYNVFHSIEGNKVLAAWPSRFCQQGQPAYSIAWDGDDSDIIASDPEKAAELIAKREAVATWLGINVESDLYLTDLFGVAGSQGSIDFADEGYPQAGVVPFGCVWTARGVLLPGDDPRTDEEEATHIVWTKAERLTSGRRDPNRIEVHGVEGAGFVVTWQEDPDGLRPGQGEGPGEGWSGAVAHSKTDIWYSFIPWEQFDLVENPDDVTGEPVNIVNHVLGNPDTDPDAAGGRPQVYVPMAVPMRLTNNDKCNAEYYAPDVTMTDEDYAKKGFSYCNYDVAAAYGLQNFCVATAEVPKGQGEEVQDICVNEDGLPNVANTASTRPRASLQGYDSDGDGAVDSAWVILAAEESKGLGRFTFTPDGATCEELDKDDPNYNPDCIADLGKNQWYFSFDMGDPQTSATMTEPNSLVKNLVKQGNMLNQPEVDYRTGEFYPVMNTSDMWAFGESGVGDFEMYNTEIARRSSLLVQGIAKAANSSSGLSAILSWKQGAMRQGGPADVMFRRIVLPYTAADCPVVDTEMPSLFSASFDGKKLTVVGTGADGDQSTEVILRNAFTGDFVAQDKETPNSTDFVIEANLKNDPVPCAVQAADQIKGSDDPELFGPWIEVAGAPEDCEGPVLDVCNEGGGIFASIEVNPYAFEYMQCETWLVDPGTNPYYPGGLCGDPATNLSSVVPDTCKDDATELSAPCPAVNFTSSTYGIGDTNPILQGYIQGEGNTMRTLTWHQCPSDGVAQNTGELEGGYFDCSTDTRTDEFVNLRDQSWYNPLDVAKGHRGFLDGDFVMFLYGWSPNWRLNAKGNDRYDLYVRRSFDGGLTFQTTPGSFNASDGYSYSGDGTVTCETYRSTLTQTSNAPEPHVCYEYPAGGNEQARNVTQHQRMRITTLDPRFAVTGGPRGRSIEAGCVDDTDPTIDTAVMTCDDESGF